MKTSRRDIDNTAVNEFMFSVKQLRERVKQFSFSELQEDINFAIAEVLYQFGNDNLYYEDDTGVHPANSYIDG